jgi:ribonuclease D
MFSSTVQLGELDDAAEVLEHFQLVSDVTDALHERIDAFLDDTDARRAAAAATVRVDRTLRRHERRANNADKNKSNVRSNAHSTGAPLTTGAAAAAAASSNPNDAPGMRHMFGDDVTRDNATRPQLAFPDTIDNSTRPWLPRGPFDAHQHALADLRAELMLVDAGANEHTTATRADVDDDDDGDNDNGNDNGNDNAVATVVPDEAAAATGVWAASEPVAPRDLDSTPLEWVDTVVALRALARVLDQQPVIAVDLEHHDYRSFLGFTCLMQVSTRSHDYLIDVLALREHMHALNSSFMDPSIVKVLHGADHDVQWMARDFGLYIVNLFDTSQAARVLQLERASLAHVLAHYCGVTLDKRYQLADWRVRPLTSELAMYARLDTHSLLYVFDVMRNELLERGLLRAVRQRSLNVSATRYVKPLFHAQQADALLRRRVQTRPLNETQLRVLDCVLAWRESVARQRDESILYVLSNRDAEELARASPLDRLAVLAFDAHRHSLLAEYADDVSRLVRDARDADSHADAVARLGELLPPLYQPVPVRTVVDPQTNRTRLVAADDAVSLGQAAHANASAPQLSLHSLLTADAPLPRARQPVRAAPAAPAPPPPLLDDVPDEPIGDASRALVDAVRQSFDSSLLAAYRAIAARGATRLKQRARAELGAAAAEAAAVAVTASADVIERTTKLEKATIDRKTGVMHLPKPVDALFGDSAIARNARIIPNRVVATEIVVDNRVIKAPLSANEHVARVKALSFQRPAAVADVLDDAPAEQPTLSKPTSRAADHDDEVTADEMQALYSQALPAFAQPLTIKKRKETPHHNAPQRKIKMSRAIKGAFALDKMETLGEQQSNDGRGGEKRGDKRRFGKK